MHQHTNKETNEGTPFPASFAVQTNGYCLTTAKFPKPHAPLSIPHHQEQACSSGVGFRVFAVLAVVEVRRCWKTGLFLRPFPPLWMPHVPRSEWSKCKRLAGFCALFPVGMQNAGFSSQSKSDVGHLMPQFFGPA